MNNNYKNNFEELENLFASYVQGDYDSLYLDLQTVRNVEYETLLFSEKINAKRLKSIYEKIDSWALLFPFVFIPSKYKVGDKISIGNKISLAYYNIGARITSFENKLIFDSYSYSKVSLYISLLLCKKEGMLNKKEQLTFLSFPNKIDDGYSQGQLIDYIDRTYDQYKHTNINISNYRTVFRSFGMYTEEIGNCAFDLFMECRDSVKSWRKAIEEFLINKMAFSQKLAKHTSNILIK